MAGTFTKYVSGDTLDNLWHSDKFWRNIVLGAIIAKVSTKLIGTGMEFLIRKSAMVLPPEVQHEKDVVYLYVFPRNMAKSVPNISPFAVKVESWLRIHNIKHQVIETSKLSTKASQIPYIIFNGEEHAESNAIISFLANYFNIDETDGLSAEQWAISRALSKMVDEDLNWTYFLERYVYKSEIFARSFQFPVNGPRFLVNMSRNHMKNAFLQKARMQGMGRLPQEEVAEIGKDDIRAISKYIGNKQYLMGSKPTKIDCSVFGHLCQIVYVDLPYAHKELLDTECTNIMPYMERIRQKYWPDWDKIVYKGSFV